MKTPHFRAAFSALHLSSTHFGANDVTRTHDLLITNQLLYRLSYTSVCISLPPGMPDKNQLRRQRNFCGTALSAAENHTTFSLQRQHPFLVKLRTNIHPLFEYYK